MASPLPTDNDEKYLPRSRSKRSGIALCLSGGGYRAALFHLGAVRRLNELGILGRLSAISSVSGGSIFAAFLARRLREENCRTFSDFETQVAVPFREFTQHDIRTTPALKRMVPWEWADDGAQSAALEEQYERLLVPGLKLKDLPPKPQFHFCATDLAFGANWIFTRDRVGDYQAGYMKKGSSGEIRLAKAVAASSCFPPVFKPMPMRLQPSQLSGGTFRRGPERDKCLRALALTDGGVYDNMGIEPVWKQCDTLLVCDGGKPFRYSWNSSTVGQLRRMNDIMGDQAEALRKRWLIASFVDKLYLGTYWGIRSSVEQYKLKGVIGYGTSLANEVISTIRTDMDRFSGAEAAVLENHGYTLADAAVRKHVPTLWGNVPITPPSAWLWPDPKKFSTVENQVRDELLGSAQVEPWGR